MIRVSKKKSLLFFQFLFFERKICRIFSTFNRFFFSFFSITLEYCGVLFYLRLLSASAESAESAESDAEQCFIYFFIYFLSCIYLISLYFVVCIRSYFLSSFLIAGFSIVSISFGCFSSLLWFFFFFPTPPPPLPPFFFTLLRIFRPPRRFRLFCLVFFFYL